MSRAARFFPHLARIAADQRSKPKQTLGYRDALREAGKLWDELPDAPSGRKREFTHAYADRLVERGFAAWAPNPSGEHLHPRRRLTATPEEWEQIDAAAKREGKAWAPWARGVLVREAGK